MLYNAALRGEDFYQVYRKVYNMVARQLSVAPAPSWRDMMAEMFPTAKDSKFPEGFSIEYIPEIKDMYHHPLPHHFAAYPDRTSYHYGPEYSYTGGPKANKMTDRMKAILELVNTRFNKNFNSVLVNKYPRGGKIPWHKDTEACLDLSEGIVGVTAKGDGTMHFKKPGMTITSKKTCGRDPDANIVDQLAEGDCVLIGNKTQERYSIYQESGMAYLLTKENLEQYYHMRDGHTIETYTFTFRRVVPSPETSPPLKHNV